MYQSPRDKKFVDKEIDEFGHNLKFIHRFYENMEPEIISKFFLDNDKKTAPEYFIRKVLKI